MIKSTLSRILHSCDFARRGCSPPSLQRPSLGPSTAHRARARQHNRLARGLALFSRCGRRQPFSRLSPWLGHWAMRRFRRGHRASIPVPSAVVATAHALIPPSSLQICFHEHCIGSACLPVPVLERADGSGTLTVAFALAEKREQLLATLFAGWVHSSFSRLWYRHCCPNKDSSSRISSIPRSSFRLHRVHTAVIAIDRGPPRPEPCASIRPQPRRTVGQSVTASNNKEVRS